MRPNKEYLEALKFFQVVFPLIGVVALFLPEGSPQSSIMAAISILTGGMAHVIYKYLKQKEDDTDSH